jgi:predicted phosphodiesterase
MTQLRGVPYALDMKIAVIGDIHSNDLALKAVIADTRRQGIATIIDLGDGISGPIEPAKTADMLVRADRVTVLGDHDRRLLGNDTDTMPVVDSFAAQQISAAHRAWLRTVPKVWTLGARILACHGTPDDDTVSMLEVPGPDGRMMLAPRDHIERLAQGLQHDLILTGHSHVPRMVRLSDGRIVVNPGSVGCPGFGGATTGTGLVATGHDRASYAIVEADDYGWDVSFRLVHYDSEGAARKASLHRFPDWADAFAAKQ